jgi:hypothetical protein
MGASVDIDIEKQRGWVSAFGRITPESAMDLTLVALTAARARRLRTLLFAFERLALTRPLSILEAHSFAERMAQTGRGVARTAFVINTECAAVTRHLATAAANRGLEAAAFVAQADALAWLDAAASP